MPALAPPPLADLTAIAQLGTMPALMRQLAGLGGCGRPIRLDGWRAERSVDTSTGEIGPVLHHLDSADLPAGHLLVRCGNRRTTRCPACAETYRRDTYHLITAGLTGGKGTPDTVATHPRVFATFTAPGFGPVHNRPKTGRCRCGTTHPADDSQLGTPLNPATYDYEAAVLWNAHAGKIWARFSIHLRREVAKRAGLTQREFADFARISFGKVAEYQKRGAIHFHAVIRLDGPDGGDTPPPAWASAELLTDAIRAAAHRADIPGPLLNGREHRFAFGSQLDIRTIRSADFNGPVQITERAVAAYIAKYATKGAETATGTLDSSLCCKRCQGRGRLPGHTAGITVQCHKCAGVGLTETLSRLNVPEHARRLIRTCWILGGLPELEELRLRAWAHMLGFRGHFSTKTRRYSTTLGALREARAAWRRAQARQHLNGPDAPGTEQEETTLVLAHWTFAGVGLTPGERWLAEALTPAPGTEGEPTTHAPA